MSETPQRNDLYWRVNVLERELEALKAGKPDVVAERVSSLTARIAEFRQEVEKDMTGIRDEMATQRRVLIGAFVSLVVALVLAVVLGQPGV